MAGRSFGAQVKGFTDKYKRRQLAVFRQSSQDLGQQANVPLAQGGKMPVDTGFLRASQAGSTSGMPSGPGQGAAGQRYSAPIGIPVEIAALQAQLGDSIWIGWTANYAIYMEARYGYARSAAQNWQAIVTKVTTEVKTRFP